MFCKSCCGEELCFRIIFLQGDRYIYTSIAVFVCLYVNISIFPNMLKIHLFRWSLFIKFWKLQKAFKVSKKLPYTILHYKEEINKDFRKKQTFFLTWYQHRNIGHIGPMSEYLSSFLFPHWSLICFIPTITIYNGLLLIEHFSLNPPLGHRAIGCNV